MNYVIKTIVNYSVSKIEGVAKVEKVFTEKYIDGMRIEIDIAVVYGYNIPNVSNDVKTVIAKEIEKMTGINLFGIDINITSIIK